jgi:hypothetical protein
MFGVAFLQSPAPAAGQKPDPGSIRTPATTVTRQAVPSRFRKVSLKPGHKWLVRNALTTKKLRVGAAKSDCPEPLALPENEPGVGGFVCSTIWVVELHVKDGVDDVEIVPKERLSVQVGDCVLWEVKAESGGEGGISLVNFFDPAEALPTGKTETSDFAIGRDFCKLRTQRCVLHIDVPKGIYRYEVKVHHQDKDKSTDPEIDVSCDRCETPPDGTS